MFGVYGKNMSVPKWQSPEPATAASPRSACTELFQSHSPQAPLQSAESERSLSGTSAAPRFPVHRAKQTINWFNTQNSNSLK